MRRPSMSAGSTSVVRRLLLAVAAVMVLGIAAAGPALAQARDPFEPLVSNETSASSDTTVDATSDDQGAADDSSTQQAPSESVLPTTGGGLTGWIGVAYVLVAVGGGFMVLGRVLGPQRNR
jgi:hypothetical protein